MPAVLTGQVVEETGCCLRHHRRPKLEPGIRSRQGLPQRPPPEQQHPSRCLTLLREVDEAEAVRPQGPSW